MSEGGKVKMGFELNVCEATEKYSEKETEKTIWLSKWKKELAKSNVVWPSPLES